MTAPKHPGHPAVLTVNKVPSPWPHPSTLDTLKYLPWTRFPHPDRIQAPWTPAVLTVNKVPSPWPHPSTLDTCGTYHEKGSLTLTAAQHPRHPAVLTVSRWIRFPHPGRTKHPAVLTVNKVASPWPQPSTLLTLKYLPWTRFPHPHCSPAPWSTYREQGSLTLTAPKHPAVLTVNKVPSPWPDPSTLQYLPWTRFPHPDQTQAPCSTYCEQGSLTLTRPKHPAVLTVNKVLSPSLQPSTPDTLKHLPWTRFPHPDRIQAPWTPAVLTVNKVPSPWPHPSTLDTLQYLPWTRFPHPDHSPAPWIPWSTYIEQSSFTLTTPKHPGHPAVLTVNKVPSPWPQPSILDTLQYLPWTRFPHPDCTQAPWTPWSTYIEQSSFTLTTPKHPAVFTVNKVPSPWPHPSTRDTLQCCSGNIQQQAYALWRPFSSSLGFAYINMSEKRKNFRSWDRPPFRETWKNITLWC